MADGLTCAVQDIDPTTLSLDLGKLQLSDAPVEPKVSVLTYFRQKKHHNMPVDFFSQDLANYQKLMQ